MKLFKPLIAVLLSLLAITSCGSTKSTIDHTRASLVRIETGTEEERGVCSGFVIKPQKVLSASHCLAPLMTADGYEAKILKNDAYYDLILLDVKQLDKKPLNLRPSPVAEQEKLLATGYAWGWAFPISEEVTVLIPSYALNAKSPVGIVVKGTYMHGMSGGPVVDLAGNVVGIVQQSRDGLSFGVDVTIIKAFLHDAGVE